MDLPEIVPDPDFTQKSAEFLQWFNASPGTRLSQKIQLADLRSRSAGRGVGL
jgi:N-lysine methyltransferase SETD6